MRKTALGVQWLESRRLLVAMPPGDFPGTFNSNVEFLDTSAPYNIVSDGVIAPGAMVTVGPGVEVTIANNVNWLVRGVLRFESAAEVGFFDNNNSGSIASTSIEVQSGGVLDAENTPFVLLTNGNDQSFIQVEQGGQLLATGCDFSIKEVIWKGASTLGVGDVVDNVFTSVVVTSAESIPLLENNDSFGRVEITGQPVQSDTTVRQMGTVSTANLYYRFVSDVQIEPGVQMKFEPGTKVELATSVNLNIGGKLWFDNVSEVGFFDDNFSGSISSTSIQVQSGGELAADSTPFVLLSNGNDESFIEIQSGGRFEADDSDFSIKDVIWRSGAILNVGDVINNVFGASINVSAEFIPRLENNDSFGRVEINGQTVTNNVVVGQMGTVSTANLFYRFTSDLQIDPGVLLKFAPGTSVELANSVNVVVGGKLWFDDVSEVGFYDDNFSGSVSSTSIEVQSGGELEADSTPLVLLSNGNDNSFIEIESGGRLKADDSDFSIKDVIWRSGAILNVGDVVDNVFAAAVNASAELIPRLEDNDSFGLVEINGQTVQSNVVVRQMGNVSTANLFYRFTGDLQIDPGVLLKFDPGTRVEVANSVNINVGGKLWFDDVSEVGFFDNNNSGSVSSTSIEVQSGGELEADSTPFVLLSNGNDNSFVEVESGGRFKADDSDFSIKNIVWRGGSILNFGDVVNNVFGAVVTVPAMLIPRLENNDSFGRVDVSGESVTSDTTIRNMGTVSTTNLSYRLTSDLQIDAGAQLKFNPGTHLELANSVNVTVAGKLWFCDVNEVALVENNQSNSVVSTGIEVVSGGELHVESTPLLVSTAGGNDTSGIAINPNAIFRSDATSRFQLGHVDLHQASTAMVEDSSFDTVINLDVNEDSSLTFDNNNFGSAAVNVSGLNSEVVDMTNNWWGTTNASAIEDKINHQVDDPTRPLVVFDPFLSQPPQIAEYVPTLLSVNATPIIAGQTLAVEYEVANTSPTGDGLSQSAILVYLNTSASQEGAMLLAVMPVEPLAAFTTTGVRAVNLTLPEETDPIWSLGLPGTYTLSLLVDATDVIPEFNEKNNVISTPLSVLPTVVTVSQTDGQTEVAEGATSDTLELTLRSVPTSDVTVTAMPDEELDLGAGPGQPVELVLHLGMR
ncbi:CARDB domain-containing protein [Rhodopirellula sp. MGV]|uniref:CARDB domain-containing protein n=1 Tax=Rhodopirellula sp. MGV TaxID=2023130 RepID=UPI0013045C5D|nr:CARDB domain-containing protein [Rhodopirellula sp. MGV]